MRFTTTSSILLTLFACAQAHLNLIYPTSRGPNHATQLTAPCGGKNDFSNNRTLFNPDGGPVAMTSSHPDSGIEINFCPSSSDCSSNDNFNITLVPTFLAIGAGPFCLPNVTIPDSLYPANRSSYLDGTIQVISYSDDGELYNCADVTISPQGAQVSSQCVNATGASSAPWKGSLAHSEESASASESGASATPTVAASSSAASSAMVSAGLLGTMLFSLVLVTM
ncbi:uncharacterized protein V1513DRAFT_380254 [Lipomyces chichibuensis]|uniref:uncharacterized protein n=1 Tax=Lipomyces chichibuensis TaxID=1546026 RepID=UPI0033441188